VLLAHHAGADDPEPELIHGAGTLLLTPARTIG
jgi:hypothetical protein